MRLDDFENEISPVIFQRGEDYYEDGLVEELDETAPGIWCAVVAGTMDYETEVCVKEGEIVSWDCDCPYDGYICKHAAVGGRSDGCRRGYSASDFGVLCG